LPLDDLLGDLADRFVREALDPGDALGGWPCSPVGTRNA
jgi:hypothetical protein